MTNKNTTQNRFNVVAVIPARQGSKGLACKNIRPLLGKPLIAWTIEQALRCKGISMVVVSTDSEDIAAVAESYGAQVPFIRPAHLSTDTSLIGDVIAHAKEHLKKQDVRVDAILTLLPSHPFRPQGLLDKAVEILSREDYSTFTTALKVNTPPGSIVSMQNNILVPTHVTNRGLPETYHRSIGLVSGHKEDCALNRGYVYTIDDPRAILDIDDMQGFLKAEQVLGGKADA